MRFLFAVFVLPLLGCPQPVEEGPTRTPSPNPVRNAVPTSTPAPNEPDRTRPTARPTVRGGAGTWESDAPSNRQENQGGAVCSDCDIVVVTMCSVRRDYVDVYQTDH